MPFDYDMIVVGAGAGGLTAAGMSALLGAKRCSSSNTG